MYRFFLSICFIGLLVGWLPEARVRALSSAGRTTQPVQVEPHDQFVRLAWTGAAGLARSSSTHFAGWPRVSVGGVQLPAQLVTLRVKHAAPVVLHWERLVSVPWAGDIVRAERVIPQTGPGELRPALAADSDHSLPDAPVFVLREGYMRGERLVVLAASPLYQQAGTLRRATSIAVDIPGASPLGEDEVLELAALLDDPAVRSGVAASAAAEGPVAATHAVWLPSVHVSMRPVGVLNPVALRDALRVVVRSAGMQRVSGHMLASAGLDLTNLVPAHLQLWHNGTVVALEEFGTHDGRFDPTDEIRFYASAPGDRWNTHDTYWLTVESGPGLRMDTHAVPLDASTPVRVVARQQGVWRTSAFYDSTLPGPDGDHWFAADLRTGPGQPPAALDIALVRDLPHADGPATYMLRGSAYTAGPHHLVLQVGSEQRSVTWQGTGDWAHSVTFSSPVDPGMTVRLMPGASPSGVELDSVTWDWPVMLQTGGKAVTFMTDAPDQRYQLSQVVPAMALYDISSPRHPVRLALPVDGTIQFQEDEEVGTYVLADAGTLSTPVIEPHAPRNLAAPLNADVLYIAPASFHASLAPLVVHRQAQGYTVAVVDVQAIYDIWGGGQVSPQAIRAFLQYAMATWSRPPMAVTLVGDGTSDPLNYTQRNNPNIIPPYLAMVDPWLGETACDTCYAQLDGSDPLSDPLPDLLIGRLPVSHASELATVVTKILRYETGSGGDWRRRAMYLTDNAYEATGQPDPAGDFIAFADAGIALQPPQMNVQRLSYDPSPGHAGVAWREPDPGRAHQRTRELLNAGAGVVTFFGHSHEWQWALTDTAREPSHMLELFDVDTLSNGERLPVVLALTCLSSAFQTPAYSGTTIDERLVLHARGGALAVWGSSGRGVAYGHDLLQRGFQHMLWNGDVSGQARLGALVQAGYLELFVNGRCCQETLRTFVLLGDPLTQVDLS